MASARTGGQTQYVCLSLEHIDDSDLTHGHFTIKSGTWGYCAESMPQGDHEWRPVDGVLLGSPQELGFRIRSLLQERGTPPGPAEVYETA